ncbi:hypothetical protein HMJ29_09830 [Hymenobacter taeanensis]|uniref:Uncharacterized protein n=1 Tax=Hymenobacter taeanensis TaxID=2735321 RepID=A0A6M6BGR6_9BACT|nr:MULTISPECIES: hypothetical protein [Hymenobacter]QJX47219.1 hypothetical protein HMJ29_09830 [Hymenobacter taeanensis]UOQ81138.1 hypothetical protein MUN83_20400 [Hymenobacter sp. 5414T-23]
MSKHKKDSSDSLQQHDTSMGPDALKHAPGSAAPGNHSTSGGTHTQNPNQNQITVSGNPIKNNTPGGNINEVRSARTNKPRSNPNPSQQSQK